MTALLLATTGGLLLSLAFPPIGFDFLVWVAFIPLFWSLRLASRPHMALFCGAIFGFGFFLVDLSWIYDTLIIHGHFSRIMAIAVFLAMIIFLSIFPAIFAYLVALFSENGIGLTAIAPFLWVAQEYLRSMLFTGFPWDLVGYSQANHLLLVQVADVTGVYGISFLIVLVNATLWELIQEVVFSNRSLGAAGRFHWKLIAANVLALVIVLTYGQIRVKEFSFVDSARGGCQIGVLQGNIPQEVKWEDATREKTFAIYEALGRKAVEQGANLLIWPETAAPVVFGTASRDWMRPGLISDKLGVPMLVGAPSIKAQKNESPYYNSAFLVDSTMLRFRYDKMHLVPFGEYMPLSSILPLGPGIAAREADYAPGETMTVMHCGNCPPFSVLICYEAIFPELARLAMKNGAKLLVNITNDGWFGDTGAPYQHLAMTGLRSIENRVWLLRSANTGISAAFDPSGKLVKSIPLQKEGLFTVAVNDPGFSNSFYTRFGNLFVYGCIGIVLFLAFLIIRFRWRGKSWTRI
jgi:apolipoprotein N-acyltransferase